MQTWAKTSNQSEESGIVIEKDDAWRFDEANRFIWLNG